MAEPWYKNAVVYALDVECFMDSNGDGVGDFQGLIQQLDYLAGLGVNCLWLLPFFPTPNRDDGYDVADYYGIDPRLGTLGDFVVFMREARQRGIRVLVELVVNHTSSDHPWFRAARSDPGSPFRDYYIWLDEPPSPERRGGLVFPGEQASNWTYDPEAGAYYWHWFYDHQPDLNTGNPAVREEIKKIMGFWLELGVSGFRMDAAPFLFKRKGLRGTYPDDPHSFLVELRQFLSQRRADAVFLAEADVATEELSFFLGAGERMHLLFNFYLNNYFFLAVAQERADALVGALQRLPACPAPCQWANFIRNHDELNLSRLSEEEREEVFQRFAPDPDMRIYGRGIRRRLPPMLEGDRRRLELVYSLLFALPGVPVLRYGEEIGMGDDQSLPGRLSVRTPMQWSGAENAAFSTAPPDRLVRPVISGGRFGYETVNVDAQRNDPDSLLNFTGRLIRTRKECPEIGFGDTLILQTGDPRIFAARSEWQGGVVATIHNLSGDPVTLALPLEGDELSAAVDLLSSDPAGPRVGDGPTVTLGPYGFRWMRLSPRMMGASADSRPSTIAVASDSDTPSGDGHQPVTGDLVQ